MLGGVAAAALHYFNKPLNELNLAEAAYLAALPKAPNNYNPVTKHDAALARRNWVIERMAIEGYVTAAAAEAAKQIPVAVAPTKDDDVVNAPYFAEEVRRELVDIYGKDKLLAPLQPGMQAPPHAMAPGATDDDDCLGRVTKSGEVTR